MSIKGKAVVAGVYEHPLRWAPTRLNTKSWPRVLAAHWKMRASR